MMGVRPISGSILIDHVDGKDARKVEKQQGKSGYTYSNNFPTSERMSVLCQCILIHTDKHRVQCERL